MERTYEIGPDTPNLPHGVTPTASFTLPEVCPQCGRTITSIGHGPVIEDLAAGRMSATAAPCGHLVEMARTA